MYVLKSRLFRGDARLAAALTDHARHVTQGDRGPHVRKIQNAVLLLEGGEINGTELADQRYGRATAKAVLMYKSRRGIINKSYQSTPDDIVGMMTIRALDEEMAGIELQDLLAGMHS